MRLRALDGIPAAADQLANDAGRASPRASTSYGRAGGVVFTPSPGRPQYVEMSVDELQSWPEHGWTWPTTGQPVPYQLIETHEAPFAL